MPNIYFSIEDIGNGEVRVKVEANSEKDFLETDDEELTAAEHLAKRVFAFISTIEADEDSGLQ